MKEYLKQVLQNDLTGAPSSRRVVFLSSSFSLCIGFLASTLAFMWGDTVNENIVIGLGGIVATLAGGTYTATKLKETKVTNEEHSSGNQ